jgi:hypothetical protein
MRDRSDSITQSSLFEILNTKDVHTKKYELSSCIGKPITKSSIYQQVKRPNGHNNNVEESFHNKEKNTNDQSATELTKEASRKS